MQDPIEFKRRLYLMAQLHYMTVSANAAEMAFKAFMDADESVPKAISLIAGQFPQGSMLGSLKERITVHLAMHTLLSFAPETHRLLVEQETAQMADETLLEMDGDTTRH